MLSCSFSRIDFEKLSVIIHILLWWLVVSIFLEVAFNFQEINFLKVSIGALTYRTPPDERR